MEQPHGSPPHDPSRPTIRIMLNKSSSPSLPNPQTPDIPLRHPCHTHPPHRPIHTPDTPPPSQHTLCCFCQSLRKCPTATRSLFPMSSHGHTPPPLSLRLRLPCLWRTKPSTSLSPRRTSFAIVLIHARQQTNHSSHPFLTGVSPTATYSNPLFIVTIPTTLPRPKTVTKNPPSPHFAPSPHSVHPSAKMGAFEPTFRFSKAPIYASHAPHLAIRSRPSRACAW